MTKDQALKSVTQTLGTLFQTNAMNVQLGDSQLTISPDISKAELDAAKLVNDAYSIGRDDTDATGEIKLGDYLTLDRDAVYAAVVGIKETLASQIRASGFQLDGEISALGEAEFSPDTPLPQVTVSLGSAGYDLDADALTDSILEAYADASFHVDGSAAMTARNPQKPDLKAIQQQITIAPVDARLDRSTKTVIPGSYGVTFDLQNTEKLLAASQNGEDIIIPLQVTEPAVTGQEAWYQDILGFGQTPHNTNEKRCTNLRLACEALNGIVLQPGDELSYNATLGQRTREGGYQDAPAYSGKDLVDSLGGGICQVSSTLYLAAMYAELEATERVSHGYVAAYMPVGLDATVSWPEPDLKLRNNTSYPIKIIAESTETHVRVWLMGTEERDYDVRLGFSSSMDGYAWSYLVKYDKQSGQQLSRDRLHLSSYFEMPVSLIGEIGQNQCYVNGNVVDQEPCEPSEEILTASRNYHSANEKGGPEA